MNDRERFLALMRYEPADRRPLHLAGPWQHTIQRWQHEGLPEGVNVHEYLGVKPLRLINVSPNTGVHPAFEQRTIEESDTVRISIDGYGRTVRDYKDHTTMPEWIDFPVKDGDDLRRVIDEHYRVDNLDERFGPQWEERIDRAAKDDDAVILVDGGCYYWTLRSLSGVETASYLLYDAPDAVEELFERYCTVVMEGLRRAVKRVKLTVVGFGEDIAYKNGPLMAPDMFRRMILPRYRRAMDFAHEHGVEFAWYDSDGDLRLLVPDYLSVGINAVAPCEVAAGMVPTELRKQFGRDLRLIGGIDKRAVAAGREAIDAEIARNLPLIREGGFLPAIDHSVPSDVSFDDYRYFLDRMQEALVL